MSSGQGGHALDYKACVFYNNFDNLVLFWNVLAHMYFNKFSIIRSVHILYIMDTVNQFKIDLVNLLADENEYINDSFVIVLSQKRF